MFKAEVDIKKRLQKKNLIAKNEKSQSKLPKNIIHSAYQRQNLRIKMYNKGKLYLNKSKQKQAVNK